MARRVLRENGLSIALFGCFLLFLAGHAVAGHRDFNADREAHGETALTLRGYLGSSHFLESVTENWESEFLQMFAYVLFTAGLDRVPATAAGIVSLLEPLTAATLGLALFGERLGPVGAVGALLLLAALALLTRGQAFSGESVAM